MRPENQKKNKPEDMLLRVIRVAEILAKGLVETPTMARSDEREAAKDREISMEIAGQKHKSDNLM